MSVTSRDLIRILLRRWYLVGIGAVLSLGFLITYHDAGVYWTQFDVVLLPPTEPQNRNTLADGPYGLTPLAGIVAMDFNRGERVVQMSSSETTLYGEGLRSGQRVRLKNGGSQWQPLFERPVIDVQVVDPSAAVVEERSVAIIAELQRLLNGRQHDAGVHPTAQATLQASPSEPVVRHVGGSRSRSALAIALLGSSLTFAVVYGVDRLVARRSVRISTRNWGPPRRTRPVLNRG